MYSDVKLIRFIILSDKFEKEVKRISNISQNGKSQLDYASELEEKPHFTKLEMKNVFNYFYKYYEIKEKYRQSKKHHIFSF